MIRWERRAPAALFSVSGSAYAIPSYRMNANASASRTPLYLTYALMLFGFGSISAARIALSLYALHLGASASAVGALVASLYIFPVLTSWHVGRYSDRVG